MQKKVRSACLFVIAILIGIAPTVGGIKSDVLFWCCIGLSAVLAIIAIGTLAPAYALLFRKAPRIEQYPVSNALNFKITNDKVKAGLGGVELRLNRLLQWDGHRNEFMPVNGYRPLVLSRAAVAALCRSGDYRREAMGPGLSRTVGRRDRQASRFAL